MRVRIWCTRSACQARQLGNDAGQYHGVRNNNRRVWCLKSMYACSLFSSPTLKDDAAACERILGTLGQKPTFSIGHFSLTLGYRTRDESHLVGPQRFARQLGTNEALLHALHCWQVARRRTYRKTNAAHAGHRMITEVGPELRYHCSGVCSTWKETVAMSQCRTCMEKNRRRNPITPTKGWTYDASQGHKDGM